MRSYAFGPVPSRRLGRSLGVDLVPYKTCSYDCIYCQLGRTTCITTRREEWVPLDGVLDSIQRKLGTKPDYITLSGSGEPTLFSRLDELIDRIKRMTKVPVAVLTNGSLMGQAEVRRQLWEADLVVPSLDAGDEVMFQAVNRPHGDIVFESMADGLADLRREFSGEYWLEVFVVGGYTAIPEELAKVARCVERIRPDRVHLNTVTRPPAEPYALAVSDTHLAESASLFHPRAEIVADYRDVHRKTEFMVGREDVVELLRRRPCRLEDIASGLDMHRNEVVKYLEQLRAEQLLDEVRVADTVYFKVNQ